MKKKTIIDERGRLFGKISVIDVAVILIAVAMVAAHYLRSSPSTGASAGALTDVTYQLTVREVRQVTADLLRVGDTVYDEHGVNMGVVERVDTAPALIKSSRLDGSYTDATNEGRLDVELTLRARCAVSDGHILAERKIEIAVGNMLPILTKYVKTSATVTDIADYQ